VGTYTFQNGNVYSGEFHHGGRDGFGVLEIKFIGQSTDNMIGWNEPTIYVGSFRDGFRNGYGLLIAKSGVAYAGMFKDNLALSELTQKECQGEISAAWTNCIGSISFATPWRAASRRSRACSKDTSG
jgi:MORN repeat